jgi:KDO2-lipid IV(A) lauroyltransferase
MRQFSDLIIYIGVRILYGIFEILPLRAASALGGFLGRMVGPLFPVTNIARKNLARVLPERAAEHKKIIHGMWDNLGRVFAEYPHLKEITENRGGATIELVGTENLQEFINMNRGGIIITGHMGNWELGSPLFTSLGAPVHVVYRPPNNPLVDKLISRARGDAMSTIQKGAAGAREIIRVLRNKEYVGMLIDQKMNDGISVPFMGVPAMTVTAPAQLAIRQQVPICVIRCERLEGVNFRGTISPPFIPAAGADEVEIMTRLNEQLGAWVRERPEQWLWVHRRWGK